MTENKRFTNTDNGFIVDYESKQKVLNLYDVIELLNELHEENEQLQKDNKRLRNCINEIFTIARLEEL